MAQKNPTILGHFDLITKLNGDGALFDESSTWYQNCTLEALAMANPKETLLEINTGGMFRGYRTKPYPALFLLQQWKAMGGEIILTSDAHSTQGILFGYEQGAAVAKQAGFSHHCLLTATGKTSVELE